MSYNKIIDALPSKVMFTEVNITVLRLTTPDFNLKRMHQLYNVESKTGVVSSCILAGINCDVPW